MLDWKVVLEFVTSSTKKLSLPMPVEICQQAAEGIKARSHEERDKVG